jgi:hypothetical protein
MNRGGRGVLANTLTAMRCVPPKEDVCDRSHDHGAGVEQDGVRAGGVLSERRVRHREKRHRHQDEYVEPDERVVDPCDHLEHAVV